MSSKQPSGEEFGGVIGRTVYESTPWWPESKIRQGAPNVVLVVLDDTGFSHLGCYGSTIATPNIDALAAGGVRFTGFHTTALCSPTRACVLTGRNPHARSAEHTSELQSLMRLSYAVFCLKTKTLNQTGSTRTIQDETSPKPQLP